MTEIIDIKRSFCVDRRVANGRPWCGENALIDISHEVLSSIAVTYSGINLLLMHCACEEYCSSYVNLNEGCESFWTIIYIWFWYNCYSKSGQQICGACHVYIYLCKPKFFHRSSCWVFFNYLMKFLHVITDTGIWLCICSLIKW